MRTPPGWPSFLALLLAAQTIVHTSTSAQVIITDFDGTRPLEAGFFTWGPGGGGFPLDQFQAFVVGAVTGQEVVPIGGGNPTVSGFGFAGGFAPVDITSQPYLQLTARLLPANEAAEIRLMLSDADGTSLGYSLAAASFNSVTFASATTLLAGGVELDPGALPGMNFATITSYRVGGNSTDGGGAALFQMQFDSLMAVPEPASVATVTTMGLFALALVRRLKRR